MCTVDLDSRKNLPGDFLMPGHPFWDSVRPSEELNARIRVSPAMRSGDPDDPVVEIVYLFPGTTRPGDEQPPIAPVVRFLKRRDLIEGMMDIWGAVRPLYDWLANGSLYRPFRELSLPKSITARIHFELGIGSWETPRAGESGRWQLFNEDLEKVFQGPDPVALLVDPANKFDWKARAWLHPLRVAHEELQAFVAGEISLGRVLQQVHGTMVLG